MDTVIAGLIRTEKKLDIITCKISIELRALKFSFLGNIIIINISNQKEYLRIIVDKIQSQALAENLAQTQVKEIVLSPESQWLLKQSTNYFGIQQRTKQFLEEFHHHYANWDEVLFLLRQSVIGDLWFYLQLPERDNALSIILRIFEEMFQKAEKK